MNTYITLACVLAVAGLSHGSAIGLGSPYLGYGSTVLSAPILAPAAISTANLVKAAPIPVIRTSYAPVISAPIIKTVPIGPIGPIAPLGLGWNSVGLGGLGLSGLGVKNVAVPNAWGVGGWGVGGYGNGGWGNGGWGNGGWGNGGWGHGGWGKI